VRATNWEFTNRAMIFGLIFGAGFLLYTVDHQNSASVLADHVAALGGWDATRVARAIFVAATALVALCALARTWASAYLREDVVYAADLKTAALVADGPYRHVRNPLYFGNVLLAIGVGAMTSRLGFVVVLAAMVVFCYRLIFREEAELLAAQGERYEAYRRAVPRLVPSIVARVPSAGTAARWGAGFRVEAWCWSFAIAYVVFDATLSLRAYFVAMGIALAAAWLVGRLAGK
jgi:protein-S-isoprenylcysteine O-methyltransferase Ste14